MYKVCFILFDIDQSFFFTPNGERSDEGESPLQVLKGQQISKQNCRAKTSPKKITNEFEIEIQVSSISGLSGQKNKLVRLFFGGEVTA